MTEALAYVWKDGILSTIRNACLRRIGLGGEFQAVGFIPYFSLAHLTEPIIFKRSLIVSNEGLEQS